jgi:hypothetical protein
MMSLMILTLFCIGFFLFSLISYKKNKKANLFILRAMIAAVILACDIVLALYYFSIINLASFSYYLIITISVGYIINMVLVLTILIKPKGNAKIIIVLNILLFSLFVLTLLLKHYFNFSISNFIIILAFSLWVVSAIALFVVGKKHLNIRNVLKAKIF